MKTLSSKIVLFILLCSVLIVLSACAANDATATNQSTEAPMVVDDAFAVTPKPTEVPIHNSSDILNLFSESVSSPFDAQSEKHGLVCAGLDSSTYAIADEIISVSDTQCPNVTVHCTWASAAIEVFVGFKACDADTFYTVSSTGGVIAGTFDLSELPDGDYQMILYSNDNPSVVAVMQYVIEE